MKVLLISNYEPLKQLSMARFGNLMRDVLIQAGEDVRVVRPRPVFSRFGGRASSLSKYLGYIDRYVVFPLELRRAAAWADVVHICDHSDAMYLRWLGKKPHVVTCHDMIGIRNGSGEFVGYRPRISGRVQQRWILRWLRRAQHIVCVSEQTREELVRVSGIAGERSSIVCNALNYPYRPTDRAEASFHLARLGLAHSKKFVLHVGGNQWYKNRAGLLRIFKALVSVPGQEDLWLVMAGKPWTTAIRDYVRQAGLEGRVLELTAVSNEELRALYSTARALVFPSLYEGFGWPIIEAQACGCPVFTSDRPPMTDVGGEGAVYFDPEDELGAAREIAARLADRERMQARGAENAARYSRESMVAGYLDAYRRVAAEHAGECVSVPPATEAKPEERANV